ncbi:MAG: LicD family protein [Clostridia bacterium]|nr:LicD family protein [Clostridia bacterium]
MDNKSLKEIQKIELEILLEVDKICKKHNIKYFLAAGTLLGAIRHKGFIPWDDDIDICMPLNDYKKFCKVAPKELDKNYFFQNYETDYTSMLFAKVRKNNTTAIEAGREHKKHHHGVWIDIFPLIGIANDKEWINNLKKWIKISKKLLSTKIDYIEENNNLPFFKRFHKIIPLCFVRLFSKLIYNTIFKSCEEYDFCYYLWAENNIKAKFKSELFSETTYVDFEGYIFPAPKMWDEYLQVEYGDYMTPPPPEDRNGGCHTISIVDLTKNYSYYIK